MPDVIELSTLDAAALRELCAELLAGMKALEARVAALEARPVRDPIADIRPPYTITAKDLEAAQAKPPEDWPFPYGILMNGGSA